MKFMITYEFSPENRNSSGKRFLDTGGGPPAGVTMLGRWHKAAGLAGYVLCESADAEAISNWIYEWNDLLRFDVAPVLEDEQTARVLSKALSPAKGARRPRGKR